MCSVRQRPIPEAPKARATSASCGVSALVRTFSLVYLLQRSINAAKSPETSAALVSTLPLYTSPVVPFREMKSPSFKVIPSISTVRVL